MPSLMVAHMKFRTTSAARNSPWNCGGGLPPSHQNGPHDLRVQAILVTCMYILVPPQVGHTGPTRPVCTFWSPVWPAQVGHTACMTCAGGPRRYRTTQLEGAPQLALRAVSAPKAIANRARVSGMRGMSCGDAARGKVRIAGTPKQRSSKRTPVCRLTAPAGAASLNRASVPQALYPWHPCPGHGPGIWGNVVGQSISILERCAACPV